MSDAPLTQPPEPVDRASSGLDAPARRALRRTRLRASALWLVMVIAVLPLVVMGVRHVRAQTGQLVSARVVAADHEDTGVVIVTWHGGHERSVIHVSDATDFCSAGSDTDACKTPAVRVDPDDPGHASIDGEWNVSAAGQIYFWFSLSGLLFAAMFAIPETLMARRRRRILANASWHLAWLRVHGSRARARRGGASCSIALVGEDDLDDWRPLQITGRGTGWVVDAEQVEVAFPAPVGRALVRLPGRDRLFDARVDLPGHTPTQVALQRVVVPVGAVEALARGDVALVLTGALGSYDMFDADGVAVGEVAGKFRQYGTSTFVVTGRDGAPWMTVTKRGSKWNATDADGSALVAAHRSRQGKTMWFDAATVDGAGVATFVTREKVRVHQGGGSSKTDRCWTLCDDGGTPLARVTGTDAKVIDLFVDPESPVRPILLAQCLVVAIGGVVPSNHSGGAG